MELRNMSKGLDNDSGRGVPARDIVAAPVIPCGAATGLHYKGHRTLKPIIKWAGGKGQLVSEISKRYPAELGHRINKYAEPFIGGGAVMLDVLSKYDLTEVYISDINSALINTYVCVRDNLRELLQRLHSFEDAFSSLDSDERREMYYKNRDRYNELVASEANSTETAALFIFLNKTCFNGLYRVNKKGSYNVPMGSYSKPIICDEANLFAVSEALKNVDIVCADYRASGSFIDENTFVYFDPPYRPLSPTSSFNSYTEHDFNDEAQLELAAYIQELAQRGAYIVLSNSDPQNANPDDDFFDSLYSQQKIERVRANRMINSNASSRGKISELLISNY